MKKKIIIVTLIILTIVLAVVGAYFTDINRMENNKPVIFSTWGYDYAVPEEDITPPEKIGNDESVDVNNIITNQLTLILNNKVLWYKDTEFDIYSYAVTDLDKNGRMEIISSICQGTGMYTYTQIYEVNENVDNLNLCESNLQEYDSQADIIKNNWKVFYDNVNNKYHYIFDDLTKNGAAEYYENKRDFCLKDGAINETYLVRKNTIYQSDPADITFTDVNDNVISEEEYNNFEDTFFADYEKMMVNIEWLSNYAEIGFEDLKHSYDNFKIEK